MLLVFWCSEWFHYTFLPSPLGPQQWASIQKRVMKMLLWLLCMECQGHQQSLIYSLFITHRTSICTGQMVIQEVQPLSLRKLLVGEGERRIWKKVRGGFLPVSRESDDQNRCNLGMHVREGRKDALGRVEKLLNRSASFYLFILNHSYPWALLFPWHQWANQASERLNDLPKVTQLSVTGDTFEPGLSDWNHIRYNH